MDTDILEAALKIFPRKKDYEAMPDILFGTKRGIICGAGLSMIAILSSAVLVVVLLLLDKRNELFLFHFV